MLRRDTTSLRNIQGKEAKRPKRGARIGEMMERFLEKREEETALMAKQAEEESARRAKQEEEFVARLAREKEAAESNDFSIKRCISVLSTLKKRQKLLWSSSRAKKIERPSFLDVNQMWNQL